MCSGEIDGYRFCISRHDGFIELADKLMYQTGRGSWFTSSSLHQLINNNNIHHFSSFLPKGMKTVGGKWVYRINTDAEGKERYKARFVAKGYSQIIGINYGETFLPTTNMMSVCDKRGSRKT